MAAAASSSDAANNVRVCLRIRPLLRHELVLGETANATALPDGQTVRVMTNQATYNRQLEAQQYRLDMCCGPEMSQRDFFHHSGVESFCDSAIEGQAATVFCFGQTGSGKTYTMSGPHMADHLSPAEQQQQLEAMAASYASSSVPPLEGDAASAAALADADAMGLQYRGVYYIANAVRAMNEQLISELKGEMGGRRGGGAAYTAQQLEGFTPVTMRASYVEIYQEQVNDLLNGTENLKVRWAQGAQSFFIEHLMIVTCDDVSDLLAVLGEGGANRKRAAHKLNVDSSRSHVLFTIYFERRDNPSAPPKYGKINFVDLAGSERLKDSESTGVNADETRSINKSLFTLGKVISALSKQSALKMKLTNPSSAASLTDAPEDVFVPYRDSALTKLLMDSLGGSCRTLMVSCITPAQRYTDESIRTIIYAMRTRNIVNSMPRVRMDPTQRQVYELKTEVEYLRKENAALKAQLRLQQQQHSEGAGPSSRTADADANASGGEEDEEEDEKAGGGANADVSYVAPADDEEEDANGPERGGGAKRSAPTAPAAYNGAPSLRHLVPHQQGGSMGMASQQPRRGSDTTGGGLLPPINGARVGAGGNGSSSSGLAPTPRGAAQQSGASALSPALATPLAASSAKTNSVSPSSGRIAVGGGLPPVHGASPSSTTTPLAKGAAPSSTTGLTPRSGGGLGLGVAGGAPQRSFAGGGQPRINGLSPANGANSGSPRLGGAFVGAANSNSAAANSPAPPPLRKVVSGGSRAANPSLAAGGGSGANNRVRANGAPMQKETPNSAPTTSLSAAVGGGNSAAVAPSPPSEPLQRVGRASPPPPHQQQQQQEGGHASHQEDDGDGDDGINVDGVGGADEAATAAGDEYYDEDAEYTDGSTQVGPSLRASKEPASAKPSAASSPPLPPHPSSSSGASGGVSDGRPPRGSTTATTTGASAPSTNDAGGRQSSMSSSRGGGGGGGEHHQLQKSVAPDGTVLAAAWANQPTMSVANLKDFGFRPAAKKATRML